MPATVVSIQLLRFEDLMRSHFMLSQLYDCDLKKARWRYSLIRQAFSLENNPVQRTHCDPLLTIVI